MGPWAMKVEGLWTKYLFFVFRMDVVYQPCVSLCYSVVARAREQAANGDGSEAGRPALDTTTTAEVGIL